MFCTVYQVLLQAVIEISHRFAVDVTKISHLCTSNSSTRESKRRESCLFMRIKANYRKKREALVGRHIYRLLVQYRVPVPKSKYQVVVPPKDYYSRRLELYDDVKDQSFQKKYSPFYFFITIFHYDYYIIYSMLHFHCLSQ